MIKKYAFIIRTEQAGKRLDVAIAELSSLSRSGIKTHINELLIDGKSGKISYKCRGGERVSFSYLQEDTEILPEDIKLDVVYEDDNYLVVNKPTGMVIHPAKGHYTGTLVNALMWRYKDLPNSGSARPGIVHRLDKDTSGLVLVAKNDKSHQYLTSLFRNRKITKKYKAIVKGSFVPFIQRIDNFIGRDPANRKKMAVVRNPLKGKRSITYFRNIKFYDKYSFIDVLLKTGRTHQIRVHASNAGYPVLGDPIYSRKDALFQNIPLCLVAYRITFFDKFSGKNLTFRIGLPEHFYDFLKHIKSTKKTIRP